MLRGTPNTYKNGQEYRQGYKMNEQSLHFEWSEFDIEMLFISKLARLMIERN